MTPFFPVCICVYSDGWILEKEFFFYTRLALRRALVDLTRKYRQLDDTLKLCERKFMIGRVNFSKIYFRMMVHLFRSFLIAVNRCIALLIIYTNIEPSNKTVVAVHFNFLIKIS